MSKVWNYGKKHFIDWIFVGLIFYYLYSCSYFMFSNPDYKCLFGLPLIICLYFILMYFLEKLQNKSEKKLKIGIFIVSFLGCVVWELFNETPLISDYQVLWNSAKDFANGTFNTLAFDKVNYFYVWNHQVGYATLLGFIVKIIGHRLFLMKLVEFIMQASINVFLYNITKKIFTKRTALLTTIIYSTYSFNLLGSGIINNQHMSLFLIMLSLNIISEKNTVVRGIISSVILGFAYIARPDAIIFIIAIICHIILLVLNNYKKGIIKKSLISLLVLLAPFIFVVKGYDYLLVKSGNIPDSYLSAHSKYFKFILGIQWQNMYGPSTWDDLGHYNFDYDEYNVAAKDYLVSKYKNRFTIDILPFWFDKMVRFSGMYDNQVGYAGIDDNSKVTSLLQYYGYAEYVLCLICALASVVILYRSNKGENLNLFKIYFIGMFLVHIFIEVQSRYRYPQYIVIAMLASPILLLLYDNLKKMVKSKYKSIEESLDEYVI